MIFYLTFEQDHPLVDNCIEIEAPDERRARAAVFETFGNKWAFLYHKEDFNPGFFPKGKIGTTLVVI